MTANKITSENTRFSVNDCVLYANYGVFKIVDIRRESFSSLQENLYYVLKSLNDNNNTVFVPCFSDALMNQIRPILSKEEILSAIESSKDSELLWIDDYKQRAEYFRKIIQDADRVLLLRLVRLLSNHKNDALLLKKRVYTSDKKAFDDACRLINEEFAFVLGIPKNEVISYIDSYKKCD